ncbi:MAG: hypothetical protein QGH33_05275, partial [Pirellulaceae bacterium]|nr:hypothetical protein [Pirellulaceae bacterium]
NMKLYRLVLVIAAIGLTNLFVSEVRAGGIHGRSGLPWFAYGYSGSLYGLGRLPVPPYYAIHPPVYYSLPQARPYGHSPFAHSGDYHPQVKVERRIVRNPHIEVMPLPEPVESPAETTTTTARVIANPYYSAETGPESSLASQAK